MEHLRHKTLTWLDFLRHRESLTETTVQLTVDFVDDLARETGHDPATSGVTGRRQINDINMFVEFEGA